MVTKAVAASTGIVADRLVGEPPASVHPVAAFGRAMRWLERTIYGDSRLPGVAHAVAGRGRVVDIHAPSCGLGALDQRPAG
jgi:adenosylcobinamide-phosphate synthase